MMTPNEYNERNLLAVFSIVLLVVGFVFVCGLVQDVKPAQLVVDSLGFVHEF